MGGRKRGGEKKEKEMKGKDRVMREDRVGGRQMVMRGERERSKG